MVSHLLPFSTSVAPTPTNKTTSLTNLSPPPSHYPAGSQALFLRKTKTTIGGRRRRPTRLHRRTTTVEEQRQRNLEILPHWPFLLPPPYFVLVFHLFCVASASRLSSSPLPFPLSFPSIPPAAAAAPPSSEAIKAERITFEEQDTLSIVLPGGKRLFPYCVEICRRTVQPSSLVTSFIYLEVKRTKNIAEGGIALVRCTHL